MASHRGPSSQPSRLRRRHIGVCPRSMSPLHAPTRSLSGLPPIKMDPGPCRLHPDVRGMAHRKVSGFHPTKNTVFDEAIVASNSAIHEELLEMIERYWQRQDRGRHSQREPSTAHYAHRSPWKTCCKLLHTLPSNT